MSKTTRTGIEILANTIGRSKNKIKDSFGDLTKRRGFNLKAEAVFTRLKTSNSFHDYDLASKSTDGYTNSEFLTYDVEDPVGFGIQGGEIATNPKLAFPFPIYSAGAWNPSYDGPPSLEGWNVWLYNGWENYIPPHFYDSVRTSNTSFYAPYGGEYTGKSSSVRNAVSAARATLSGPHKYNGNYSLPLNLADYQQIPKFENSRWISLRNTYGSNIDLDGDLADPLDGGSLSKNIKVKLHKDVLTGFKLIDARADAPQDIKLMYHNNLIQNFTSSWQSITLPTDYTSLTYLDFKIYPYNAFIEDNLNFDQTVSTEDYWILEINLPSSSGFTWTNNYFWHIAVYWNSNDNLTQNSHTPWEFDLLSFDMEDIAIDSSDGSIDVASSDLLVWNKKSFFKQNITNCLGYEKTGYFDQNVYLVSKNKTLFEFKDGEYSDPQAPLRYALSDTIPAAPKGETTSLVGYDIPAKNQIFPILICSKNLGSQFDTPAANYFIFEGDACDRECITDYTDFDNYPIVDNNYDVLFRCILTRPVDEVFDVKQTSTLVNADYRVLTADGIRFNYTDILNTSSIVYVEKIAINFSKYGSQDADVAELLVPSFYRFLDNLRNNDYSFTYDNLTRAIIPESIRLVFSNINELLSISTLDQFNYQNIIHFLLKKPTDTLVKNPNFEPRGIQFSYDGIENLTNLFVQVPSTNLAILTCDNLKNHNLKIPVASSFEVYQELSLLCEAIDPNISGNKIGLDYTFKLSLEDENQNILKKDLYLNASKFFLSDEDYNKRVLKGQSVTGYYKTGTEEERTARADGTLETIPDYYLYGYAGCIPDLSMEKAKPIQTRVVGSDKQEGQTREEFIASLPEGQDVNEALANYEGEFIEINLNKYPEKWVSIKEIGMTTSKFTFDTNPYWNLNFYGLIGGDGKSQNLQQADDYYPYSRDNVVADSFTISDKGLDTADNSIQVIENIYSQETEYDNTYYSQVASTTGLAVTNTTFAIKITPLADNNSQSFKLRLSNSVPFLSTGKLKVDLYSTALGSTQPQSIIKSGSSISLTDIGTEISEHKFGLNANLSAGDYWLVFNSNQSFKEYATNMSGTVQASGTSVTGTGTTFTNYLINSQIGFGSTLPTDISTWYTISDIASDTALTLTSSAGAVASGSDYVIKHQFKIWGVSTGSTTLYGQERDTSWNPLTFRPYIRFYQPSGEIYGAFNRTDYSIDSVLPAPNMQRESLPIYRLEGYYSFTSKEINPPKKLQLYPRAFYGGLLKDTVGTVSVVSGTAVTGVNNTNFNLFSGESVQIGFGSKNPIDIANWYDVASIGSTNTLTISGFATTVSNVDYLFRFDPEWHYAKYSKDMYVYVKYYSKGVLKENFITLNRNPSWESWWFLKNSSNIDDISRTIELEQQSDISVITKNLDFNNFSVSGTTEYIQAKSKGVFKPQSSGTYNFRFYSSYGIKVFINEEALPLIDKIDNTNSGTGHTFNLTLSSDEYTTFEVLHTHKTDILNSIAHPQLLVGEYKLSASVTWNNIDDTFYNLISQAPVDIDPDDEVIDKIAFLTVGKTLEEISTPTHGVPPGDRIVFRNK